MRSVSLKKTTLTLVLVVFFVFIDSLFKTLALKGYFNEPVYVMGRIFSFNFQANLNIAFSIPFSGPILIIAISILILGLVYWWLSLFLSNKPERGSKYLLYPLTFLIIGAIINLLDRLKFGYVIDYFDLEYFTVFNVADIMISVSILFMLLIFIFKKDERKYTNKHR